MKWLFPLLLVILGCGKKDSFECPEGTKFVNGGCIPLGDAQVIPDLVVIPEIVPPEESVYDLYEELMMADDCCLQEEKTKDLPVDVVQEIPTQTKIGSACKGESECPHEGAVCLDWPKGYCSILKCTKDSCPDGGICMAITPNAPACAASCKENSDCRVEDGYGCKTLPDLEGVDSNVCYQIKKQGLFGDTCKGPEECAGSAICLTAFSGGYCAVVGCGKDAPCPQGTECVKVNGKPVCLKSCNTNEDCKVTGNVDRQCIQMKSVITYNKVNVCGSGKSGAPIGAQCMNDLECLSSDCVVVYTGKCSIDGNGCLTDKDCPFGAVCQQSSNNTYGYCTATCYSTQNCPGQSFCIGVGQSPTDGLCMPACNPGPDDICRKEAGLSCVFGDPIGSPSHYACVHLKHGSPGAECLKNDDCSSGHCLLSSQGGGYCTTYFCPEGSCPFPTVCRKSSENSYYRCLKRCLSEKDCPKGHQCKVSFGGPGDTVCLP